MSQNSNQTKDNTVLPNNMLTQEIKKLIIPTNTEANENPELSFDDYISNQIDNMQKLVSLTEDERIKICHGNERVLEELEKVVESFGLYFVKVPA